MADLSDVSTALASLIQGIVYPNGIGNPSVINAPVSIFPGWPQPSQLDSDLAAGKSEISIFPRPEETVLPVLNYDPMAPATPTPTLTATATTSSVTLAGTISTPQTVALIVNANVYTYAVQGTDTLNSIAAALAALVAVDLPGTTSTGATINISGLVRRLVVRIGTSANQLVVLRRQQKTFQITIWANCFDMRDPLASAVDSALAAIRRFTLADGSMALLAYKGSQQSDVLQKQNIYRRDLMYAVQWATTAVETDYQIIVPLENFTAVPPGTTSGPVTGPLYS